MSKLSTSGKIKLIILVLVTIPIAVINLNLPSTRDISILIFYGLGTPFVVLSWSLWFTRRWWHIMQQPNWNDPLFSFKCPQQYAFTSLQFFSSLVVCCSISMFINALIFDNHNWEMGIFLLSTGLGFYLATVFWAYRLRKWQSKNSEQSEEDYLDQIINGEN